MTDEEFAAGVDLDRRSTSEAVHSAHRALDLLWTQYTQELPEGHPLRTATAKWMAHIEGDHVEGQTYPLPTRAVLKASLALQARPPPVDRHDHGVRLGQRQRLPRLRSSIRVTGILVSEALHRSFDLPDRSGRRLQTSGRPAVFVRFAGCNLWSGREQDRHKAICQFCDTDFRGGRRYTRDELVARIRETYYSGLIVFTGGEPGLQLDQELVDILHKRYGYTVAIETNGTVPIPAVQWVCVSPKAGTKIVVPYADEMKLVFPQGHRMTPDIARGLVRCTHLLAFADGRPRLGAEHQASGLRLRHEDSAVAPEHPGAQGVERRVIHYHGGPIWPEEAALTTWEGGHACVSFARPEQIELVAAVCQSFLHRQRLLLVSGSAKIAIDWPEILSPDRVSLNG
jgi:7-carboxy-7-deazaguanine synthase